MTEMKWPGEAKTAVALCFDLDADTIWKNKTRSLPYGGEMRKAHSVGLYGAKRGTAVILDILKKYGVKATFYVPAVNVRDYADLIYKIMDAGCEIAHHGYAHEPSYGDTVEEQLEIIEKSQKIFEEVTGKRARGFRTTGTLLPETKAVLAKQKQVVYSSTAINKEYPYHWIIDGKKSHIIELPSRQELDDYVQMSYNFYPAQPIGLPRISNYEDVLSNFKKEFDGAIRFGTPYVTMFHPQVSGGMGRSHILDELLAYMMQSSSAWFTDCEGLALWWRDHDPEKK